MRVFNDAETQISREGKRYKIPSDIATLSFFVNLCLDTEDSTDGGDTDRNNGGDTDRNNGNGGDLVHEIPLYTIKSFVSLRSVNGGIRLVYSIYQTYTSAVIIGHLNFFSGICVVYAIYHAYTRHCPICKKYPFAMT